MQTYLGERIELVKALRQSEDLPVRYADLALIACAVMSACAAWRWPGKNIDRKRFVELLTQHSRDDLHASWVSVPALLNANLIAHNQSPYGQPGNQTRMYTDNEIDLSLSDATRRYSEVAGRLHKHCYACLIYEQLRCSYSHNYFAGEDVTTVSPTRRQARVSYIGRRIPDPPRFRRMIHFHIGYLVKLAEYHVSVLPPDSESPPVRWWIDGTGTEPSV